MDCARRFTAWPQDALQSTAERYLANSELPEALRPAIGAQCMLFHAGVRDLTVRFKREAKRHFYVTPTSYLELLNVYKSLFARRQSEVTTSRRRYESGLDKLLFTEGQVNTMKEELEVLRPQLVQASAATDALLADVKRETAEADQVKAVVSVDEAAAKAEADKVTAIKEECEGDLAEALPALNAAIKALDTLTKNDITEVKGMKSPPAAVKMVLEAVCVIKGLKATKARPFDSGCERPHACGAFVCCLCCVCAVQSRVLSAYVLCKLHAAQCRECQPRKTRCRATFSNGSLMTALALLQVKDVDSGKMVDSWWETAKKMMTDTYFLESLRAFDKDNIDPDVIQRLQPLITKDEFEPKKILKVSKAAYGLACWVKAMDSYHRVAKVVKPKREALKGAEAQLKVRL